MNSEQDGFNLLLLAVVLFQLPTLAIAQRVTSPSATPTLADRLDLDARQSRAHAIGRVGRGVFAQVQARAAEEGAERRCHDHDVLSHCTLQPSTELARGK
jgi:hypothetical protein